MLRQNPCSRRNLDDTADRPHTRLRINVRSSFQYCCKQTRNIRLISDIAITKLKAQISTRTMKSTLLFSSPQHFARGFNGAFTGLIEETHACKSHFPFPSAIHSNRSLLTAGLYKSTWAPIREPTVTRSGGVAEGMA